MFCAQRVRLFNKTFHSNKNFKWIVQTKRIQQLLFRSGRNGNDRTPSRARINEMEKFYCFTNAKNVSSPILPLAREARERSSSVPHDMLHLRIITPMLATQRETLLRHVFVRPRQNERRNRERGERDGMRFPQTTSRAWKFACKHGSCTHFVMTYCLTIHRFVWHLAFYVPYSPTGERRLIS